MRRFVPFFLLLLLIPALALAHPGKTDSKGGHYDRSTGEYHYHHGYPAHDHENGVCPYDFKDKTGQSSGTSGGSSSYAAPTASTVTNAQRKRPDQTRRPRATIYYKGMKIRPEEAQGDAGRIDI